MDEFLSVCALLSLFSHYYYNVRRGRGATRTHPDLHDIFAYKMAAPLKIGISPSPYKLDPTHMYEVLARLGSKKLCDKPH
jgi:hypothetical protein